MSAPAPEPDQSWQAPVERRSLATKELQSDCWLCLWDWAMCGGPRSRLKQLYVHGKLTKCWGEYQKFKSCLMMKLGRDAEGESSSSSVATEHAVWKIRSKKEASEFWAQSYSRLGARPNPKFADPS